MRRLILIIFLVPTILFAQDDLKALEKKGIDTDKYIPKGIKVGERAPEIRLTSVTGKSVVSTEILKQKPKKDNDITFVPAGSPLQMNIDNLLKSPPQQLKGLDALPAKFGVFDLETIRSAEEVGGWGNTHKMGASGQCAKSNASNSAKTIDSNFNCHVNNSLSYQFCV